jgi:hypothetical protein
MKKSNLTKIGMAAVGVLLLAWVILKLAGGTETKSEPIIKGKNNLCPECGLPLSKAAIAEGKCANPSCRASLNKGGSAATSPAIAITLVCLFAVLLGIHLSVRVHARVARAEEKVYYYNCPKCLRKIRYRESQVGRGSQCPLCRRPMIFPPPLREPREPLFRSLVGRVKRFLFPNSHHS